VPESQRKSGKAIDFLYQSAKGKALAFLANAEPCWCALWMLLAGLSRTRQRILLLWILEQSEERARRLVRQAKQHGGRGSITLPPLVLARRRRMGAESAAGVLPWGGGLGTGG
jgi:hypothetical protein